ncbi:MAG: oligoendopeptidase F [Spirochaetaceae bacterium]|nr:oligoendopeptidase F [Spirochaetaceae bacterium]
MAETTTAIPERSLIPAADRWDLGKLFPAEDAWDQGLKEYQEMVPRIAAFKGTLGESAANLRACLEFLNELEMLDERVGYYAMLRTSEDAGDSDNQGRFARYLNVASRAEAEKSYVTPEIQAIPDAVMEQFLADVSLAEFAISLRKLLRFKPHVLAAEQERLLAMQIEANQTARKAFAALTDVDLDFGTVDTPDGPVALSQSSWSQFMINPDRDVRRRAYRQFYGHFEQHKNTLAALYGGSVQLDIYRAKVRGYPSAREAALFPDRVDTAVYDNLVAAVHDNLAQLHAYYGLRRRILGVDELRHYDVYVPLTADVRVHHTYDQAVDVVIDALAPLGDHYRGTLRAGLLGGWVDRYENKGKRSGAFSSGSFVGDPYILMNYKEDVLRDVFTLAHEAGHSMHSWNSVRHNPIQHYSYSIFEAEVASTFNEQLLFHYLMERAETREMKAYLVGKQVDDIIATIYRQTMFAEFEHLTHRMAEQGEPLTVDSLRTTYRQLLERYFGDQMVLEELSDLEGLRIPHFYNAFYVYKYATGLAAAVTLAERVLAGGAAEREQYMGFLRSGGSRYPLESLQLAGVDMSSPAPVEQALRVFGSLVEQLEQLG